MWFESLIFYVQDWAYSMTLFLHEYNLCIKAVFQQFLENSQMQLSVRYILTSGLTLGVGPRKGHVGVWGGGVSRKI